MKRLAKRMTCPDTMTFTITPPPSANKLFRNKSSRDNPKAPGRIKTREYASWKKFAAMEIKLQRKGQMIDGPFVFSMTLPRYHPLADLDNRIKPTLDALQASGAVVNDKDAQSVTASWADHERCIVTVSPA